MRFDIKLIAEIKKLVFFRKVRIWVWWREKIKLKKVIRILLILNYLKSSNFPKFSFTDNETSKQDFCQDFGSSVPDSRCQKESHENNLNVIMFFFQKSIEESKFEARKLKHICFSCSWWFFPDQKLFFQICWNSKEMFLIPHFCPILN
jgi:hypothetical protein